MTIQQQAYGVITAINDYIPNKLAENFLENLNPLAKVLETEVDSGEDKLTWLIVMMMLL